MHPLPHDTPAGAAVGGLAQVWVLQGIDQPHADALAPRLMPRELERAKHLRDPGARSRFVVARAALRTVVGAWLDLPPRQVPLTTTAGGKPVVDVHAPPQVNVSHTADTALIALHPHAAVGVDIEVADRTVSDAVMARTCTPAELADLHQHGGLGRSAPFLRLWVRKEAVAKADGRGLGLSVGAIDVRDDGPLHPGAIADSAVWLHDLDVGPGHVAALATVGTGVTVRLRRIALRGVGTEGSDADPLAGLTLDPAR